MSSSGPETAGRAHEPVPQGTHDPVRAAAGGTGAPSGRPRPHAPTLGARVACFTFIVGVLMAVLAAGAFVVVERGAIRRADADTIGVLVDQAALSIADRLAVSDASGAEDGGYGVLVGEVERLAEARGVQQVALVHAGGAEVVSAQSREFTAARDGSVLPLPSVHGPARQLRDDHLLVARAFRMRDGDGDEALLVVRAGYPSLEARMRDLVALSGRVVGLASLLLVFLLPLAARVLARAHGRAAAAARSGELVDPVRAVAGGAELVELALRIEADGQRVREVERQKLDLTSAARAELVRTREALQRQRADADEARAAAHKATSAKANFVANTSHEIRTPLHAVIGTTSLLLQTDLDAEQRTLAERSLRASHTLLSLVEDVLDLARFDAREVVLELGPFDPGALVEEVAELAAPLAAKKGIDMATFVSPECPERLIGDARRIRQGLMRLVENAIKFTDAGEVTIDLAWEARPDGAPQAVFTVADTGIGIDKGERERLFQAFEQIDGSDTRRYGGVGLGLALVARIARAFSGEVRLESRRGQGARFGLALPLDRDASDDRGFARRVAERSTPLQDSFVLVVDDAEHGAKLFGRSLELLGARVQIEPSTYAGWETFVQGRFDLVFIDAGLAGRDAFLGALASNEQRALVPVVLMTAPLAGEVGPEGTSDHLVSAAIPKPLSRVDIESIALRVLGRDGDKGSTEVREIRERAEERKALLDSRLRRRLRVLLVEDNHTNQQLVHYVLGKRGYQIDVASNGVQAVDAFQRASYDAVIMDCQMPEMDGYEATRRMRELEAGADRKTPILAMTASVLESDRRRCIDAGMDDMLAKPFQPHRMVEWLEGWLLRSIEEEGGPVADRVAASGAEAAPGAEAAGGEAAAVAATPAPDGALDTDVLGALLEDDEGRILAHELIDSFLQIAPARLRALDEAARGGDFDETARIAHALVSTSGTVGAVRLAELLREVRRCAREGSREESVRVIAACRDEVEAARLELARAFAG